MKRPSSLVAVAAFLLLVLQAPSSLASDHSTRRDQRTLEQPSGDAEEMHNQLCDPETRADRKAGEQPSQLEHERCSAYGPKTKEWFSEAQRQQRMLHQFFQVLCGEQGAVCSQSILTFEEDVITKLDGVLSDPTSSISATSPALAKKNQITFLLALLSKPMNCTVDTVCKSIQEFVSSAGRGARHSSLVNWIQESGFFEVPTCGGGCLKGFYFDAYNEMCQDIDECRENTAGCDHECENTIGSYRCKCRAGYFLQGDQTSCQDVDECRLNVSGCGQECENTDGSFRCKCRPGFWLKSDGKSCADIDECRRNNTICSQVCVNTIGSYRCECKPGYFLMEDNWSCDDFDECSLSPCSHICINEPAGYICSCPEGFLLNRRNLAECIDVRNIDPSRRNAPRIIDKCTAEYS